MNEESVGKNIRAIRKQRKLTLKELAALTGFTKSYLSKIERSKKAPPYSTVNRIAKAFEVEVAYLLSEKLGSFNDIRISLNRKSKGEIVDTLALGSSYGPKYTALAFDKPGKNLLPFIIEPSHVDKRVFQHDGEEFIYVLKGEYEFTYDGKTYVLEASDSVYFDSGIPHSGRSLGQKKAKILAIMFNYKRL